MHKFLKTHFLTFDSRLYFLSLLFDFLYDFFSVGDFKKSLNTFFENHLIWNRANLSHYLLIHLQIVKQIWFRCQTPVTLVLFRRWTFAWLFLLNLLSTLNNFRVSSCSALCYHISEIVAKSILRLFELGTFRWLISFVCSR
jgi:hypothetical protein